jgi:hypothetical protein
VKTTGRMMKKINSEKPENRRMASFLIMENILFIIPLPPFLREGVGG